MKKQLIFIPPIMLGDTAYYAAFNVVF